MTYKFVRTSEIVYWNVGVDYFIDYYILDIRMILRTRKEK